MLSLSKMAFSGAVARSPEVASASRCPPLLRLSPDKVRPSVACGSSGGQVQRFRKDFKPSKQVEGLENTYGTYWGEAKANSKDWANVPEMEARINNPLSPPKAFWRMQHPEEVWVRTAHANHARIFPTDEPGIPAGEEQFVVELHRNYDTEWPNVSVNKDGMLVYRPGFLNPIIDPELPNYYFYRGISQIRYTLAENIFRHLATALFIGLHVAVGLWCWESRPALVAGIIVSYMRNTLSFGKWALLGALAATDKMWIFWATLVGKEVDKYLEKHAKPLRHLMWLNFMMWMLYIVLTPTRYHPLPIWPFGPASQGLHERAFSAVGALYGL